MSTPESPNVETPPALGLKKEPSSEYLTPHQSIRSVSRNSQSSVEDDLGQLSDSSQTLNRSSTASSRTGPTSPSSTSTFLATLKAKAAATDKQALSNQAKDTIRKWSANWASLRQDKDKTDKAGNPAPDEMPDVGPSEPRSRVDSERNRTSYADVRAAVAERKERERLGIPEPVTGSETGITSPVNIPATGKRQSRTVSVSSSNVHVQPPSPSLTAVSTSPTPTSVKRLSGHIEGTPPKISPPAVSRSSTMASSHTDPFSNDVDRDEPPAPIQSQPQQAKTMMIPRIHASHKGDVMSMGHVASSPAPSNVPTIAPAIQSVYRLWKSPTASAQQIETPEPQDTDVQPLILNVDNTPRSSSAARPTPPPLPPRSNSTQMNVTVASPVDGDAVPSSPASEALKSIRQIDVMKRTQDDARSNNSADGPPVQPNLVNKPPLPPRKSTTSLA